MLNESNFFSQYDFPISRLMANTSSFGYEMIDTLSFGWKFESELSIQTNDVRENRRFTFDPK